MNCDIYARKSDNFEFVFKNKIEINIKDTAKRLLTEKQYKYTLMYFNGFKMDQIATREHVNKSTVSRTIKRSITKLRNIYGVT